MGDGSRNDRMKVFKKQLTFEDLLDSIVSLNPAVSSIFDWLWTISVVEIELLVSVKNGANHLGGIEWK